MKRKQKNQQKKIKKNKNENKNNNKSSKDEIQGEPGGRSTSKASTGKASGNKRGRSKTSGMQIQKKEDNVLIVFPKRKMGILIRIHLYRNQSQRKIVNVVFPILIMMMRIQQMEYRIKNLRIKSRNKKITVMMNCLKGIMILSVG